MPEKVAGSVPRLRARRDQPRCDRGISRDLCEPNTVHLKARESGMGMPAEVATASARTRHQQFADDRAAMTSVTRRIEGSMRRSDSLERGPCGFSFQRGGSAIPMKMTIPSPPGFRTRSTLKSGFQLFAAHAFPAPSKCTAVMRINGLKFGGALGP